MNLKRAALNMIRPVKNSGLPDIDPQCGKDHMLYMIEQIASAEVAIRKRTLWLSQNSLMLSFLSSIEEPPL